ncbi:hypothetical protein MFTT_28280 [Mycolicibacterium fortuitum subsp. fortuitum]|nr:hypothetical protein MFTT_28280 [Mycolicibacterium fortuitum subsp. fortuitum]
MYGDIFGITAIVCVVGAVLGLLIAARNFHADELDGPSESIDNAGGHVYLPGEQLEPDTQILPAQPADETVQLPKQQPPGRHRSS